MRGLGQENGQVSDFCLPASTFFQSLLKSATLDALGFLFVCLLFGIAWGSITFQIKLPLKKSVVLEPQAGTISLKECPGTGLAAGLRMGSGLCVSKGTWLSTSKSLSLSGSS